ncbi:MAG: type II CAAX endopeptidase family protein [Kofleriaceae bacterium]
MSQHRKVILFVVLAYALSWLAWAPLWLAALRGMATQPSPYWHLAGGMGPLLAAVVVSVRDRDARARLLTRTVRVRGQGRWILGAALGPIVLGVGALASIALVGGSVDWRSLGKSPEFPWLALPVYWLANLVCYGFGEEVGWRGFLLPRLQNTRHALTASLIVAAIWAGWHLPLFAFSPGMSAMGVGGIIGWAISILTGSVITTWLFNASGGSVMAVALFHGVLDIVMLSPAHPLLPTVMGGVLTVTGFVLPRLVGRANLSGRARVTEGPQAPGRACSS